jgi:hypothetical protein
VVRPATPADVNPPGALEAVDSLDIATWCDDGVAFAAIQALSMELEERDPCIEDQHDRIERLESKVGNRDVALDALRAALDDKDERNADLEDRLQPSRPNWTSTRRPASRGSPMTDGAEPITLTVEIDPAEFDEPRAMMFERLVEEFGHETVAELVGANLQQDPTAHSRRRQGGPRE